MPAGKCQECGARGYHFGNCSQYKSGGMPPKKGKR